MDLLSSYDDDASNTEQVPGGVSKTTSEVSEAPSLQSEWENFEKSVECNSPPRLSEVLNSESSKKDDSEGFHGRTNTSKSADIDLAHQNSFDEDESHLPPGVRKKNRCHSSSSSSSEDDGAKDKAKNNSDSDSSCSDDSDASPSHFKVIEKKAEIKRAEPSPPKREKQGHTKEARRSSSSSRSRSSSPRSKRRRSDDRHTRSRSPRRRLSSNRRRGSRHSRSKDRDHYNRRRRTRSRERRRSERYQRSNYTKSKRSRSRERSKRSPSWEKEKRSVSKEKSKRSVSKERNKRSVSKDRSKRSVSKDISKRSVSKDRSKRSVSKDRSKRSVSKEKSKRSQSKERSKRSMSRDKSRRSVSRERSKRSLSKDRSRSKDRNRKRSKSRERRKRSKSRERSRRNRSRERNQRSRSRDRRKRSRSRNRSGSPREARVIKYGDRVIKAGASFGRPPPSKPMTFKEKMRQQLIKTIEEGGDMAQAFTDKDGTVICTQTAGTQQIPAAKMPPVPLMANLVPPPAGLPAATITASEAAVQSMLALQKETTEKTGVEIPKYYNPAAINPVKYAEQVQKRKLLWSKTKDKDVNSQWNTTSLSSDHDDRSKEKFRKLMGIKQEGANASVSGENTGSEEQDLKQKELFEKLDKEYQFARMATHTHRGVGLGFGSSSYQPHDV